MRNAIRKMRADEGGMSLIEIMIATFVLSVALLALASTAITSIVSLRVSRTRQEATDAASAMIENLRRADYATIALSKSEVPVGVCDTDPSVAMPALGSQPYDEPVVTTELPGALPREQSFGPSGRVTVTTSVTWYDEENDGGCTHTDRGAKRVRVVAAWVDKGQTRTVEESTIVAPVDRGLPAPDFRLGTKTVTLTFTPSELGTEKCVGHVVRNLGADDGYDWTVARTDSGSVYKPNGAEFTTQGGKVRIRAFMENPAGDPPVDPATLNVPSQQQRHANLPPGMELLVDGNGNNRPETDPNVNLDTGQQGRLWICYLADSSIAIGTIAKLQVTVHSQLDQNRTESVAHEVRVTKEPVTLFLYDDDTSATGASGPRVVTTSGTNEVLPVQFMGPESTLQPQKLGTSPLPNYDTDFDTYPGLRLKDGPRTAFPSETSWAASTVAFHEQVTPGTVFEPTIGLDLYSASQDALQEMAEGDTAVTSRQLDYRVRLQVLRKNEQNVVSTPLSATVSYTHSTADWVKLTPTFTLTSPLVLENEQFLRLEITCLPTSEDVCHVAYDNQAYPSALNLVVQ